MQDSWNIEYEGEDAFRAIRYLTLAAIGLDGLVSLELEPGSTNYISRTCVRKEATTYIVYHPPDQKVEERICPNGDSQRTASIRYPRMPTGLRTDFDVFEPPGVLLEGSFYRQPFHTACTEKSVKPPDTIQDVASFLHT